MTLYLGHGPLADDIPRADAVEQQQPTDVSVENAGLDSLASSLAVLSKFRR
jgi:hypothetical protein